VPTRDTRRQAPFSPIPARSRRNTRNNAFVPSLFRLAREKVLVARAVARPPAAA
jgi:hypothetical protein